MYAYGNKLAPSIIGVPKNSYSIIGSPKVGNGLGGIPIRLSASPILNGFLLESIDTATQTIFHASTVDSKGNIYSCGTTVYATPSIVSKTDSKGNLLWVKQYASGSLFYDLCIDELDNIYIASRAGIVKIDVDGNVLSAVNPSTVSANYCQICYSNNRVYLIGRLGDLVSCHNSSDLSMIYSKFFTSSNSTDFNVGITADTSGNVYFVKDLGRGGTNGWNTDWLLVKLDSAGNVVFQIPFNSSIAPSNPNIAIHIIRSISLDYNGNIYIVGSLREQGNTIVKLDSSGAIIWQKSLSNSTLVGANIDVYITKNNTVLVTQILNATPYVFITCLSTLDGTFLYENTLDTVNDNVEYRKSYLNKDFLYITHPSKLSLPTKSFTFKALIDGSGLGVYGLNNYIAHTPTSHLALAVITTGATTVSSSGYTYSSVAITVSNYTITQNTYLKGV